jgi:hypothetical protein
MDAVKTMQSVSLTTEEKIFLAEKAHELRFEGAMAEAFNPRRLLLPRRIGDTGDDLFSVLNVIQENIIRGGLYGIYRTERGSFQRTKSREVKSIDANIRINRELWSSAERLISHVL